MSQPPHQRASSKSGDAYELTEDVEEEDELSSPSSDEEDEEWTPEASSSTAGRRGSGRQLSYRLPSSSIPSLQLSSSSRAPSSRSLPTASTSSSHQPLGRTDASLSPSSSGQSYSPPQQTSTKPFNPSTSRKRIRVGPKPRRFQSNPKQVAIFMESFSRAERPSKQERIRLAEEATKLVTDASTTVTERNVNVWFQNRRQHLREADRGLRPAALFKRRRSEEVEGGESSASSQSQRSPSLALPPLQHQQDYIRRELLFESSPIVIIPASSLVVDSWIRNLTTRPASPSSRPPPPPDLVLYASSTGRYFAWYISHAGRGYKMQLPFTSIAGFRTSNGDGFILSLSLPPSMWCTRMTVDGTVDVDAEDGVWEAIGDYTDGIASRARVHRVNGANHATRSTMLNLITSTPELSHLLAHNRPVVPNLRIPQSSQPSSYSPQSTATATPGSSSTLYPPPLHPSPLARTSASAPTVSIARMSLDPLHDASNSNPFALRQPPVARSSTSAGERSMSHDLESPFATTGLVSRPWTAGEREPGFLLEHPAPPLPRQQYLPPPHAPLPHHRQRYDPPPFGEDQPSFSYEYAQEQPSSGSGSEQFRFQPQYQDPYQETNCPATVQPHQRYISAPLPISHRRSSATSSLGRPPSSSSRPPPRQYPAHPSPPSSSSTSWPATSSSNSWPYPHGTNSSSSEPWSYTSSQNTSSEVYFNPDFAPQQTYHPDPYHQPRPDAQQAQSSQQLFQYDMSPPPSAERIDFDPSYDASYRHHGGLTPPRPPGRGGHGGSSHQ